MSELGHRITTLSNKVAHHPYQTIKVDQERDQTCQLRFYSTATTATCRFVVALEPNPEITPIFLSGVGGTHEYHSSPRTIGLLHSKRQPNLTARRAHPANRFCAVFDENQEPSVRFVARLSTHSTLMSRSAHCCLAVVFRFSPVSSSCLPVAHSVKSVWTSRAQIDKFGPSAGRKGGGWVAIVIPESTSTGCASAITDVSQRAMGEVWSPLWSPLEKSLVVAICPKREELSRWTNANLKVRKEVATVTRIWRTCAGINTIRFGSLARRLANLGAGVSAARYRLFKGPPFKLQKAGLQPDRAAPGVAKAAEAAEDLLVRVEPGVMMPEAT
ncbi:hypothetical protein BJY52DRAFT_1227272 [Lactarius psammicola]|nr:hypothetical protein BJY52DRAFT_1227272 [Lactarius psammicola]